MGEVTDLEITAAVRRELSGCRVDLTKLKFHVTSGLVNISGELTFVALEKSPDEVTIEIKFIESRLRALRGVKDLQFQLENLSKNESGKWEYRSSHSGKSGSQGLILSEAGIKCSECNYEIRFCPCCGKPLGTAGSPNKGSQSTHPLLKSLTRKPELRPSLSKAVTPLAGIGGGKPQETKIVKPDIPKIIPQLPTGGKPAFVTKIGLPHDESKTPHPEPVSDTPKGFPVNPPTLRVGPTPTIKTPPDTHSTVGPTAFPQSRQLPTHEKPTAPIPIQKPGTVTLKTIPQSPHKTSMENKSADDQTKSLHLKPIPQPPKPGNTDAASIKSPSREHEINQTDTPKVQEKEINPPSKIEPKEPPISEPESPTDLKAPPSTALKPIEKPKEPPPAIHPPIKPKLSAAEPPKPPPESPHSSETNLPPVKPHTAPAIPHSSPKPPLSSISSTEEIEEVPLPPIKEKISLKKKDDLLPFLKTSTVDEDGDTPLPPLKPRDAQPPAIDEDTPLPPLKSHSITSVPVDDDDTPLPPQKPKPAESEIDDIPLPPLKPKLSLAPGSPKPGKESAGDPFAALFPDEMGKKKGKQDTPQNTDIGNKESMEDLTNLDMGMLDLFQKPGKTPLPKKQPPGKTPPKPPKPGPSKDDPLNLTGIFDLDAPVEPGEKKDKPGGGKDPFSLDDFDLSKFKI